MNKETKISPKEIMHQREQLIKQKEFLIDVLSKIEKQILALQVERLHLRSTLLGSNTECQPSQELSNTPVKNNCIQNELEINNSIEQQLDLSIPPTHDFEEEVEEDDESSS